jgi:hypothetical protein
MVRTQIQLTEEQVARLRRLALSRGLSIAALIREAVDRLEEDAEGDARWRRSLSVVGKYRGGSENVAEDHDEFLVDAYVDR